MAALAAALSGDYAVSHTSYPARTKTSSATIKGLRTVATAVNFADKILITVHVPLDIAATDASVTSNAYLDREEDDPSSDLLPMHHLTATTILGGTVPGLEILGQTLATQIASAIKTRDERETRIVVLGMGLDKSMASRGEFGALIGLVLEVI
ncbi:hypothetical protein SNOG_01141 [Parastagonospora nodorum SN15]|uniref:Proteasome assembly chaperone 3 n=1 Tax=Phaeosphaeria nodorum (strain SN15 / ATCC MYA-4574 / FGSC 10173) TaxID=321614 RepID=Q0V4C3_PHANO|nr:hypothetical protein SNOG_01141 [Parastagonospora nodorum SN15]EAT90790.1 hypothetical protein SNOG_01141 [Parastagonospora nodorum SN15]